jgi:general nucleoside transport system permease protein
MLSDLADLLLAAPFWIAVLHISTPFAEISGLGIPLLGYVMYRTPLGLALRMVGENPQAAEGQAVSVAATRTGAFVVGSALVGVDGSFRTLAAGQGADEAVPQGRALTPL